MRSLPAHFVVFTLALLLVGTTPLGTGTGLHQFDLLHPLFSHVHIVNGRVVTHEQMAQGQADAAPAPTRYAYATGPAFGAGSAPAQVDAGLGTSPTLPVLSVSLPPDLFGLRLPMEPRLPLGRVEAPPDPPPTSAA